MSAEIFLGSRACEPSHWHILACTILVSHGHACDHGWPCIGYQLVGRTLPIWNTFGRVKPFTPQTPWLLRFFDQVQPINRVFRVKPKSHSDATMHLQVALQHTSAHQNTSALQAASLQPAWLFFRS